jgi:hypothetical protein
MPVRMKTSIKASSENEKRKFVSSCFRPTECNAPSWLHRTISDAKKQDQESEVDCCQRIEAQQLRVVIGRSTSSEVRRR